jgi:DNA-binding MarR family transcriptional regulator
MEDSASRRLDPDIPSHLGAWSTPGFVLWHATHAWQQEVARVLAPFGLTHAQLTTLGTIWWLRRETGTAPSQRDIAAHSAITDVLASQVIRSLEQRGLVARDTDKLDTRIRRLSLTEAGSELTREAMTALDAADRAYFAHLDVSPADLIRILNQIAGRDADGRLITRNIPQPRTETP